MSLQVWLPFEGDLQNKGCIDTTFTTSGYSESLDSKLMMSTKITGVVNSDLTYDKWNYGSYDLSFGGWVKLNKSEINAITSTKTYSSTNTTAGGNIFGCNGYGGFAIRWKTNNIYTDGSLSSIDTYVILRTTGTGYFNLLTSSFTIPFDIWTHLFVTLDRNAKKVLA